MNSTKIISLPEWTGFVIVDDLPAEGGCNILCLSDRQIHILRRFVYPFAEWRTRYVRWLYGHYYQLATEAEYSEYQDVVNELFNDIKGENMGCSDLAEALMVIAEAIPRISLGGNNGGNCSGVGIPGQAAGYAGQYTNAQLIAPAPGSVTTNIPPDGFETWEAYLGYKCRAAQQVFAFVLGFCRECQSLKLLVVTATIVGPLLAGWMGVWGAIAITPAGWIAAISSLVAIGLLESLAFKGFELLGDYLLANKESIICALYLSGDAVEARAALAGYIEDGIQAIEWSTIGLEALGPAVAGMMGQVMAVATENGVVNILFELQADIAYPDAVCDCAEPEQPGTFEWHFENDDEGWEDVADVRSGNSYTNTWTDAESGSDTGDGSAGRLHTSISRSASDIAKAGWLKHITPDYVYEGDGFLADVFQSSIEPADRYALILQYSDASEDVLQITGHPGWERHQVLVTNPNSGKVLNLIYVLAENLTTGTTCYWAIDKVSLTISEP